MTNGILDTMELAAGIPLIVIVPALVELTKQLGLPARFAGLTAIATATLLLVLGDLTIDGTTGSGWDMRIAGWILGGIVYGLAAAGLYSQRDVLRSHENDGVPTPF